jgi:serine/threonine-protein kinase
MIPEKIGRYEIKAELGRGGMATVYRAYDPTFEREVALKILPRELLHDIQFRARFERESRTIAKLEHAAIVPVYDVGEEDGQPYFVMRCMNGGALTDLMADGPLPLTEVVRVIDRLAPALDYAHAKGIIHRDLKPANIMFDEDGEPYVSDFGIAKMAESKVTLTGGNIVGTPAYMSPEQAQGNEVDPRSDIYSLGVIVYEMLCGRQPFESDTPLGMAFKHVAEPIPHILDTIADLPVDIEIVLEKAMAKNKEDRFTTNLSFAAALAAVARGEKPDLKQTISRAAYRAQNTMPRATGQFQKSTTEIKKEQASRKWVYAAGGILVALALIFVLIQSMTGFGSIAPEASATPEPIITPSATVVAPTEAPSPTIPAAEATSAPAPSALGIGGADRVAFITDNKVWSVDLLDGSISQLTKDRDVKVGVQWLPDGNLVFINSTKKCAQIVDVKTNTVSTLVCFTGIEYFDAFRVSPDGTQVSISIDRLWYVLPYDTNFLTGSLSRQQMDAANGCIRYNRYPVLFTDWSADSKRLANLLLLPIRNGSADTVSVMDVHSCADPLTVEEFPGMKFTPEGYGDTLDIPAYDWDGVKRFVFNTFKRNDGYGELFYYEIGMNEPIKINPIDGSCCYRDARFSPDGQYLLFLFQDFRKGQQSATEMYYIPFDEIGTNVVFKPLSIPLSIFANPREKPGLELRPVQE